MPPDEGETLQPGIQCDVSPKANIVVDHDRKRAELTMSFKFTADPKKQPYVIEITIVGAFGLQAGTIDHLTQFAKAGAASVLFPFVREMIYQVTRDARWGPLRLNPINMQEILKWQQNVEEISGPSEPEQQREQ